MYDTSTFTQNRDGSFNDQPTHTPGARYWIPTLDEWVKAAYYDPNRYGPGQEGYWLFPDAGNEPLISGYPDLGGETNAGEFPPDNIRFLDVGSYPHVRSPWGLLDLSGGEDEWLEDTNGWVRSMGGTQQFEPLHAWFDRVDFTLDATGPEFFGNTIRLATSIPSPGAALVIGWFLLFTERRQRRCSVQSRF